MGPGLRGHPEVYEVSSLFSTQCHRMHKCVGEQVSTYMRTQFELNPLVFSPSLMPTQAPVTYLAEENGRVEHIVEVFSAQRRYLDAAFSAVRAFSPDDNNLSLSWCTHATHAGEETAHLVQQLPVQSVPHD